MEKKIDLSQPALYQIRIKGHLSCEWEDWFDGLTIKLENDGNTLLTGLIGDQAALLGLIKKVRDLGLTLISIGPVEPGSATTAGTGQIEKPDDQL